jgi:putative phosphoesterase
MKILLLSDIHSNIHALEAIWRQEKDSDQVYCAGDLVDYGPCPREVIDWIRTNRIPCVQGNHDAWVSLCYRRGDTLEAVPPAERAWVHHNAGMLDENEIRFLENLPKAITFEADSVVYGITHLYREYDEITSLYAFQTFCKSTFNGESLENLIMGHTHQQAVRYLSDSIKWINPGSVSYRRRGDPDQTAHYATIVDGVVSLHRLVYDLEPVHRIASKVVLKESEMRAAAHIFGPRNSKKTDP